MAVADARRRVCVGQIGAPHGVRGELRVKPFTRDPAAIARYGPLETEDGARSLTIVSARLARDMLVVRFKGVDTRDDAELLRHMRLYVPRDRLEAPGDDEFYHADLIGLDVVRLDGVPVGTIVAVPNFGAGDLIEIAPGHGGPSVLIPFTKTCVPLVDLAAGRIVINPPEGMIETAANMGQGGKP